MLGKYERLDVLGHGVSGIVYLAKDTLLNKQIALKEVDVQAGDIRRFLEEARVMDRLRHPNIVRVNGVDRIEGKIVIDMEYVRGENLQDRLRTEGHLPMDVALDTAAQVLDALDYAHRMQTVHRDIKPANILIGRDGQVKLVDFGLAEILATNAYAGGAGTYAYMAPEDFAEEDHSDRQSDIWAVGVTLYEMLTGNRPFQVAKVKDPFAWKRVLENEAPTPLAAYLSEAPPALQAVLDRALARDKRQRYDTAGAFREDILRLQEGVGISERTWKVSAVAATQRLQSLTQSVFPQEAAATMTATPRTGPGVVVADVGQPAAKTRSEPREPRRVRLPFPSRKIGETRLVVEPESVDFGSLRKGEQRSFKLQARVQGIEGDVKGLVSCGSPWLHVEPPVFDRARQTLTVTANTEQAWETGEFTDTLIIATEAGRAEIPIRLHVLKARPSFSEIAAWYIPLFLATLLPALVVAVASGGDTLTTRAITLIPSAAVGSGLLAMMLLLIGIAADLGIAERIACGFVMATMCFVLGVAAARPASEALTLGMQRAAVTGGILGAALALQLLYVSRWKLWAFALVCLAALLGGTFLRFLMP